MKNINNSGKIKQSDHIFALKIKTESKGLGILKTLIVLFLIVLQALFLVLSYTYLLQVFKWYLILAILLSMISCLFVLSSDYHGQAKATWILFLLVCFSFGYVIYFLSDKHILFAKSRKRYNYIFKQTSNLQSQISCEKLDNLDIKTECSYLYNAGGFVASKSSKTKYFPSGAGFYDDVLQQLEKAEEFIFIEFFIISDGVLLDRVLNILKQKASEGVDVRIIYDDMGSHGTLKRKTKKRILNAGIKLQCFNRLIPVFNIALNLRNHRKIIIIDGKVSYTGGTNLADEYINEKRMHGYWKDCGIRIDGNATDNLTISFLQNWQFLTGKEIEYEKYINIAKGKEGNGVVIPFVSGPNYSFSIAQNMYANLISKAKDRLYIMTPYFIPDETLNNLIINKARSGVDVRIILPDIADKKFVYVVSRSNAEKLLDYGVKVYTMTSSFVHSKIVLSDDSAIVGSINMDLRSFNQQFESAVLTNEEQTLKDITLDFINTFNHSTLITDKNKKRNSVFYRLLAGIFNLVSPFM